MKYLLLPLLLLFTAVSVAAQGANVAFGTIRQDTGLPVEITSDNLSVEQATDTAIFTGDVLIAQGEMRLTAPRVLVVYRADAEGIERLEATGGVTLVSGPDVAESERADYHIDSGTILMSGNVLLLQGRNALSSDKMNVNLTDGTAQMTGRVKTILQTGSEN
ncbi:lipopolysaccharide export system protein LptA [Sulfitobacter marinus]|uniref:Lipopolysaccharide export system protein LptA n=1 Tax=Sulfitobacter marinus TaxID=394264 RepID=A0A1I6SZ78_9RHOB|nr:LptA/OstA family protein [Sulfitobacter marinus]SFS82289.1 lipopolysaccharide export system protein LptA [Sulfitobacter marinus]